MCNVPIGQGRVYKINVESSALRSLKIQDREIRRSR